MYGHNNHSQAAYYTSADHFPQLDVTAPPPSFLSPPPRLFIPALVNDYFEPMAAAEVGYSSSSSSTGCSSYGSPSSLTSYSATAPATAPTPTPRPSLIQRSVSSHSLRKNYNSTTSGSCRQLVPTPAELPESETSMVRRVFSTGDLQRINMVQHYHRSESPLSNENSSSIIEVMIGSKASRYGPEEKKERIERYKTKRNLRNFNKKIKYECRKTLADSRPRIRGRFARNDEIGKIVTSSQNQWISTHDMGAEEDDEDDDNWINFLDSFSANLS